MKKLLVALIAATFFLQIAALYPDTADLSFQGVVIFLDNTTIVVKHGATEMTFSLVQNTAVTRNSVSLTNNDLELCQTVLVHYNSGGTGSASRIEILTDSYCTK